ncbi:MAG: sialidase family protein, partial [Planctomycetota bacterium]
MSPSLVAPLLALLSLVLGGCATPPDAPDGLDAFLGRDSLTLTEAFASERFPNVVVTNDGTVLATFGTTSVRARRSTDGGATWGEEIVIADPGFHGGGTTVDRTTGDVLVFVESGHPPAPLTVWRSRDDGLTWTPETPTVLPDAEGRVPSMHMNEHGITLTRGPHAGRLVRPSRWYGEGNDRAYWSQHFTNAIHSDDGGLTWHT